MTEGTYGLVLRLAAPLQSWGGRGQFNRRDTLEEPTKSGVLGLLAAAQGRRRQDPIEDLLDLRLGIRVDKPGSLLRDYHTVSDYRGRPLLSATVNAKGQQKPTTPAKYTHVTQRFYLQDAVFVAAVTGPTGLLATLADAVRHPAFPLALGRRSCPPTLPLLLPPPQTAGDTGPPSTLWPGDPLTILQAVPWQAAASRDDDPQRPRRGPAVTVPVTVDDENGDDVRTDLPISFDPLTRGFTSRRVRQHWVDLATGRAGDATHDHDPFALLGW